MGAKPDVVRFFGDGLRYRNTIRPEGKKFVIDQFAWFPSSEGRMSTDLSFQFSFNFLPGSYPAHTGRAEPIWYLHEGGGELSAGEMTLDKMDSEAFAEDLAASFEDWLAALLDVRGASRRSKGKQEWRKT